MVIRYKNNSWYSMPDTSGVLHYFQVLIFPSFPSLPPPSTSPFHPTVRTHPAALHPAVREGEGIAPGSDCGYVSCSAG